MKEPIEHSLQLFEDLGFVSDEPDDNWRPIARFWDPECKEHFTINLELMNELPALLKIIDRYYKHKSNAMETTIELGQVLTIIDQGKKKEVNIDELRAVIEEFGGPDILSNMLHEIHHNYAVAMLENSLHRNEKNLSSTEELSILNDLAYAFLQMKEQQ